MKKTITSYLILVTLLLGCVSCSMQYASYATLRAQRNSISACEAQLDSISDQLYLVDSVRSALLQRLYREDSLYRSIDNQIEHVQYKIRKEEEKIVSTYNLETRRLLDSVQTVRDKQYQENLKRYLDGRTSRFGKEGLFEIAYGVTSPNFVGGCDFYFSATNKTGKRIKYIHLSFSLKNSVGDFIYDDITSKKSTNIKVCGTGWIEPSKRFSYSWENVFCNHTVDSVSSVDILLDFEDGTTLKIPYTHIKKVIEYEMQEPEPEYVTCSSINRLSKYAETEILQEFSSPEKEQLLCKSKKLESTKSELRELESELLLQTNWQITIARSDFDPIRRELGECKTLVGRKELETKLESTRSEIGELENKLESTKSKLEELETKLNSIEREIRNKL